MKTPRKPLAVCGRCWRTVEPGAIVGETHGRLKICERCAEALDERRRVYPPREGNDAVGVRPPRRRTGKSFAHDEFEGLETKGIAR
jgi:hypothetical protein